VYGIVRQSGGHVAVTSEPGSGSTFRIYLPRVNEAITPPPSPAPVLAPATGRESVLLAEDEPLVRLLAKKVLEQAGYRVLVAAGAAEALDILGRPDEPVDLLITDVVMPEISGRELAQRGGALRPGLPVLYMSGYSDDAVARHGILDPGTVLVEKPFTPALFAAKVREALGGATRSNRPD
jgi:CheY-like chemotaxis protein